MWHMRRFYKTLEMWEIGVWPWGVDFRQVHSPALRLLKGQDRTERDGEGGGERGGNLCFLQSHTQPLVPQLRGRSPPVLAPLLYSTTPLPHPRPYPSLTGMHWDNRTVLVLGLAPPWAHTGPDRRTKVHLAPLSTTSSALGANT